MAGLAVPARAQIYSWRDANGTLVLSDRPLSPDARAFASASASVSSTAVRATKSPVSNVRNNRYDPIIEQHAREHSVRADLVRAVIQVESAFNPRAVSHKGAMGLMQLMPATARELGVANPLDPAENIRGGVAYLKSLLNRFRDNEELALAAYNAGPGAVEKYGQQVPPYRETRQYVRRIRGVSSAAFTQPSRPAMRIFKSVQLVNGREVPRYSNVVSGDLQ